MSLQFWHWPDHIIYKRESRRLRDEHNAAMNKLAAIREQITFIRGDATFQDGDRLRNAEVAALNGAITLALEE